MISEGRESGWLRLSPSALQAWARWHGAQFNRIRFATVAGREDRGTAIVADADLAAADDDDDDGDDGDDGISRSPDDAIMVIPQSLVLSRSLVEEMAKGGDYQLQGILEAAGPFAKVREEKNLTCTVRVR